MTYEEIKQMLDTVGVPLAYYQFSHASGQQPPFITYYFQGDNDLKADNINYQKIRQLVIELYTNRKDFTLEAAVESALTAHDLAYSRTEEYIQTERMHMVTFYTEVLINEQ